MFEKIEFQKSEKASYICFFWQTCRTTIILQGTTMKAFLLKKVRHSHLKWSESQWNFFTSRSGGHSYKKTGRVKTLFWAEKILMGELKHKIVFKNFRKTEPCLFTPSYSNLAGSSGGRKWLWASKKLATTCTFQQIWANQYSVERNSNNDNNIRYLPEILIYWFERSIEGIERVSRWESSLKAKEVSEEWALFVKLGRWIHRIKR